MVLAAHAFVNWIDNTLGIRKTANILWPGELRLAHELRAGQGGDLLAEELGELQGER